MEAGVKIFLRIILLVMIIFSGCKKVYTPYLLDIEINGRRLAPENLESLFSYEVIVNEDVEYGNISAVASNSEAKIFYRANDNDFIFIKSGDISENFHLNFDRNRVDIVVINDRLSATYKIDIVKPPRNPALLNSLRVTPGVMEPAFSRNVTEYRVGLPNRAAFIYLNPSIPEGNLSYSLNGGEFISTPNGEFSRGIPIKTGENNIRLRVEKTGFISTDYSFRVIRYQNADLRDIKINPGSILENITFENSLYNASVRKDARRINLEIIPVDSNAVITAAKRESPSDINSGDNNKFELALSSDEEVFLITVRAVDGYRRIYTLNVRRAD